MSCLGLEKQLLPPKKAWKRFASKLRSKLRKLKRTRPIKHTSSPEHWSQILHHKRSFKPVYIDELFNKQAVPMHVEPMGSKVFDKSAASSSSSSSCSVEKLRGVDLKAEMFIAKFREEMRLQRQRSLGEYQDMLARGV